MKRAADFRSIARGSLGGHWASAVGTTFLAGILGADIMMTGGGSITTILSNYMNTSDSDSLFSSMKNIPIGVWMVLISFIVTSAVVLFVISIAQYIIGSFVSLGLAKYNLNLIDRREASVGQIFNYSSVMGKAVWLRLRMGIFIFLWSLLLIVPGIIKAYSYSMSAFIMAENPEMTAKEAMEVSMHMMNGNKWRAFCLDLSFIGWIFLSCLTFSIGFLWLQPYMNASAAAFYDEISRDKIEMD